MDFTPEQIRWVIQALIILILSIAVHEFGHAIVAHKLGDSTPGRQGRVTLNPVAHADWLGTLVFPLVALLWTKGASIGFGWGKPVEVYPPSFSRRFAMRTGHLLVAAAGPGMNVLFAVVIATAHVAVVKYGVLDPGHELSKAIGYAVTLNFFLFFFNLIPAPPLDGGAVLEGLLPQRWLPTYEKYAPFGPIVLLCFIFIEPLQILIAKPAMFLQNHLYSGLGTAFGLS